MNYQAYYQTEKIDALAISIKSLVDCGSIEKDKTLPCQMINVGIRKLHDIAQSARGKGKYLGHPVWSKGALELLKNNNGSINGITKYLSHEHLVPLKVVVDILIATPKQTPFQVYKQKLQELAAVAIITREQDERFRLAKLDKSMPKDWCGFDVFARYREVKLFDELICTC